MTENKSKKTRPLTTAEIKSIRFDLAFRGWLSLISALIVFALGVIFTIYGMPLYQDRNIVPICIPAILIAVIALEWGLVRSGFQHLVWRKGKHTGIVEEPGVSPTSIVDDIFNVVIFVVCVPIGIAVLVAGDLGFSDPYAITQIPSSFLAMAFGLSAGESARFNFWLRKKGLVDIEHNAKDKDS
jgi:hypothetical protein